MQVLQTAIHTLVLTKHRVQACFPQMQHTCLLGLPPGSAWRALSARLVARPGPQFVPPAAPVAHLQCTSGSAIAQLMAQF